MNDNLHGNYTGLLAPAGDDDVWVYPRGVRTKVPNDVCRCPILEVGDACPVHQEYA